ncbi:MAG: diguanylate cyclase domain-containing protein, partial [Roseburia sp.]
SVETFHHAILVQYFGEVMCFIGLTYFISILCKIKMPFCVYILQGILGILILYSIFTTLDNGFFYKQIAVSTEGPFARLMLTYGTGFYLTIVYIAVLSLYCLGACIHTYIVGNHLDRKRVKYTIIGIICVWLPYPIKLLGLTGGYEIPGVGITCAGVFFYQILIRYGFLDSVTLASENVLDHGDEGILVLGTDYRIQYHNRQLDEIFGDIPHDMDLRTHQWLGQVLNGTCDTLELHGRTYEFRVETLTDCGYEQGKMIWIHDATEHHESMERVREIAIKDPLTQLFNRVHYQEVIEQHLNQNHKGAFMMIDMDNFKKVNDKFGHQVGDDILKVFANVLKRYAQQNVISCRMGGDEFSVFIPGETDEEHIGGIIRNIMDDYQTELSRSGYEKYMGLSVGAVIFGLDDSKKQSFATMYNAADQVLYQVKESGKNRYEIEVLR